MRQPFVQSCPAAHGAFSRFPLASFRFALRRRAEDFFT
jgi:hypothetical protein